MYVWLKTLIFDHSNVVYHCCLESFVVLVCLLIVVPLVFVGETSIRRLRAFTAGRSNSLNRPAAYKHFGFKVLLW